MSFQTPPPGGKCDRPGVPLTDDELNQHRMQIVRGEYLEIPGLSLTSKQVERLWGFDEAICQRILVGLMDSQFLGRTSDGRFVRVHDRRS
jgi:hypothetical protein